MFRKLFGKKKIESPPLYRPAWVPPIAPDEMGIRDVESLYRRLIALWAVVGTAKTDQSYFAEYITQNQMTEWLTPKERDFLFSSDRTERQSIQFSWQSECLYLLAWCGGLFGELELPKDISELGDWFHLFPQDIEDVGRLARALKVRKKEELVKWSDKIMDIHWAVRNARLNNKAIPDGLNGDVVQEWHYAINWMVYFLEDEQDWDDVTTDT